MKRSKKASKLKAQKSYWYAKRMARLQESAKLKQYKNYK